MTTKRTRFDRRKIATAMPVGVPVPDALPPELPVAPGRKPDAFDAITAKMRSNINIEPPRLLCRRCGQEKLQTDFAVTERQKIHPTCGACSSMGLQSSPDWVRAADALPNPKAPLNTFTTYRRRVADEHAQREEREAFAAHEARLEEEMARFKAMTPEEQKRFLDGADFEC